MGNAPGTQAEPKAPQKQPQYECKTCKKTYVQKYDLRKHRENCGLPPHLFCQFCPHKVNYKRALRHHLKQKHMDIIKTEERLEEIIEETVKRGKTLRVTSVRAVENGSIESIKKLNYVTERVNQYCSTCQCYFESKSLKNSCPKCNLPLVYECRKCKRFDKSQILIKNHILYKCYPKEILACDQCHFKTTKKSTLKQHITGKHATPDSMHVCHKCNAKIKHYNNYKRHVEYCGMESNFQCNICLRKIKYKLNFDRHMHRHKLLEPDFVKLETPRTEPTTNILEAKNEPQYADTVKVDENKNIIAPEIQELITAYCPSCDETCLGKCRMIRCQKCRTKLIFRCAADKCDKEYDRQSELYRHVCNIHATSETANTRCPKCSKVFTNYMQLQHHQKTVCNDKEPHLQCNHCSFRSKRKFNLIGHIMRKHSEPEDIQCENCGKVYHNKASFSSHQMYCVNAPDIECVLCNFKTKLQYTMVEHIRCKHVEVYTDKELRCEKCLIEIKNIYLFEQHVQQCDVNFIETARTVFLRGAVEIEDCKS